MSDPAAIPGIAVVPASCGATAAEVAGEETALDTSGLTYDPQSGTWKFNWKTQKSQAGCWTIEVRLADGRAHAVGFERR